MAGQIAQDRNIPFKTLKTHIDKGILTGQEALQAKLIDRLDYADVLISEIRETAKGDPEDESLEVVSFSRYGGQMKNSSSGKTDVALIYAVGTITEQKGHGGNAGADTISAAIREAYKDDSIQAIVLRVDSPGGSPAASETIRRALVKAQEKGKKVIVSMGSVAASGGYWISADADEIIALPSTLTGSIGVIMGKFELGKLWKTLGINWETIQWGKNAGIWSVNKPFNASEKKTDDGFN